MKFLAGGFAIHAGAFLIFFISYFWFLSKKHQRAGRLNPENAYIYEAPKFRRFLFGKPYKQEEAANHSHLVHQQLAVSTCHAAFPQGVHPR